MGTLGNWTPARERALKKAVELGKSNKEISALLKIDAGAIHHKIARMHLTRPEVKEKEIDIPETPAEIVRRHDSQKTLTTLKSNEKKLAERVAELEKLQEAWLALSETTVIREFKQKKLGKTSVTPVLLLGDIHGEEKVLLEGTNGLNEYNPEICERRLGRYSVNAPRLIEITSQDADIDQVILVILGDLINGNIHEENLENNAYLPMEAMLWMQSLVAGIIQKIKDKCDELKVPLTIVCKTGNHARITDKTHISTEEGNNLEWLMYHELKLIFKDSGINWIIDKSYLTYINVYGKDIRIHHGTAIKNGGGVGGVMIAIAKANMRWDKGRKAFLTIMGHLHQRIHYLDTIMNSSVIGYNRFAIFIKADYEKPSQTYFTITSRCEITGEYQIFLED